MRIHDPRANTEAGYPEAKETAWGRDYGTRDFPELKRPFIDDAPSAEHGVEARSRWGSQPVRTFGRAVDGVFKSMWTRIRTAFGGGR